MNPFSGQEFEQKACQTLQEPGDLYRPLEVTAYQEQPRLNAPQDRRPDALVRLRWQGKEVKFLAELKARTAPKIVQAGIRQLKSYAPTGRNLLLIVPYLSDTITEMLRQEGLSGLDLNGNYFIQTADLLAIRLDRPNQYRESQPIKNIYAGSSSFVGRLLLKEKRVFTTVTEIFEAIAALGGQLSLSAVSKVLARLEEELIIEKTSKRIALLQPEKLLDRLVRDYRAPKLLDTLKLKVPGSREEVSKLIEQALPKDSWVFTGESSAERYTVTTPSKTLSAYVSAFRGLNRYEEPRFYNLVLKRTMEPFVYFDIEEDGVKWSSQIQCYLELMQLDKREKEIAQGIKQEILGKFK